MFNAIALCCTWRWWCYTKLLSLEMHTFRSTEYSIHQIFVKGDIWKTNKHWRRCETKVSCGDRFYFPSIKSKTIAEASHSSGICFLQLFTQKCPFSSLGAATDATSLEEFSLISPSRVGYTTSVLGSHFCDCTIVLSQCVVNIIGLFNSPLNFVIHLQWWGDPKKMELCLEGRPLIVQTSPTRWIF